MSYRKTAPKVSGGRTLRKNRTALSPHIFQESDGFPQIVRERPGAGYRHLLRKDDIYRFVDLLPNWDELRVGLKAILLDKGYADTLGWHYQGVVAICAWDRDITHEWTPEFVVDHRPVLDRLGIPYDVDSGACHFSEQTARGFQLMHIFLHELGHHHDRMTTRSRRRAARGEAFAETYSFAAAESLWDAYFAEFGY